MSVQQLGYDVPLFEPGQEHLPELPDPRMKDRMPHDPLGFLRAVGENPEDIPPPKPISFEETQRERDERVASIFRNQRILEAILQRHEATLQKR
jgi:hypothetical protein